MLYAVMIPAVICAYLVKGMCGFANTLVFSTMMSFTANNVQISPLELVVGYPSNLILTVKNRKQLSARVWVPLALFVLLGNLPGIFLLKNGDTRMIKFIFGFIIVFLAAEMFLRERQKEQKPANPVLLGIIGVCSGVMCGLFGIGALLAAYVGRTTDSSGAFKGNLGIVFLIENTFRIVVYSVTGILTLQILRQAALLLPFMALGLFAGMKLAKSVHEKTVKTAVILMLALSGVSLIVSNLAAL